MKRIKNKKKKTRILLMALSMVLILLFLGAAYLYSHNGRVLGRAYPPTEADIKAYTGKTVTVEGVTLIAQEGSFDSDVYFRVDRIARSNPISADGLWQISDMWEARVKYMSNDDQVNEYAARKSYILSFPYTTQFFTTEQGETIPEHSLKIVRGETATGPWTVLQNSVVDQVNKTVSTITNRGGFFTVAGGYYQAPKITSTLKKFTINQEKISAENNGEKTVILHENEVVITVTPAIQPTHVNKTNENNTIAAPSPAISNKTTLFTWLFSLIKLNFLNE